MADNTVYFCEAGQHAVKHGIFFTSGSRIIRYRCQSCGLIACPQHIVKKMFSHPQCKRCRSKEMIRERIADGVWRNDF